MFEVILFIVATVLFIALFASAILHGMKIQKVEEDFHAYKDAYANSLDVLRRTISNDHAEIERLKDKINLTCVSLEACRDAIESKSKPTLRQSIKTKSKK